MFNNFAMLREFLGRSQREIAAQLGVSIRAVQSYEQGWRPVPAAMTKLLSLLLYLKWRKDNPKPSPCWKIKGCSEERKAHCAACECGDGECCWILTGNCHACEPMPTWDDKLAKCLKCPVMTRYLPTE